MDHYIEIKRLNYEVNLVYLKSLLKQNNILARSEVDESGDNPVYQLLVTKDEEIRAREVLSTVQIEDELLPNDGNHHMEGYLEWNDKMYDPGHYTGGKIPHYLLDKSNWIFFGPYFLFGGILLFWALFRDDDSAAGLDSILFAILYVTAGVSMLYHMKRKKDKRE